MKNIPLYLFVCLVVLYDSFWALTPQSRTAVIGFAVLLLCASLVGPAFTITMMVAGAFVFVTTNKKLRKEVSREFDKRRRPDA